MILGIDVSTSITGFAIIDDNNKTILLNYCDLRKHKSFLEKCLHIKEFLLDLAEEHCDLWVQDGIKHVYIEQPFSFFNSGGSSAKTMATLQRFNGVVSWMVFEIFELKPEYIGATQARKKAGIKVPKGGKAKIYTLRELEREGALKVELTRYGNPKAHFYDMADALVIARAGLITEKEKETSS